MSGSLQLQRAFFPLPDVSGLKQLRIVIADYDLE